MRDNCTTMFVRGACEAKYISLGISDILVGRGATDWVIWFSGYIYIYINIYIYIWTSFSTPVGEPFSI
jgi:hypothetical protein